MERVLESLDPYHTMVIHARTQNVQRSAGQHNVPAWKDLGEQKLSQKIFVEEFQPN